MKSALCFYRVSGIPDGGMYTGDAFAPITTDIKKAALLTFQEQQDIVKEMDLNAGQWYRLAALNPVFLNKTV